MDGKIPSPSNIIKLNQTPSSISQNEKPEGKKGLLSEIVFVGIILILLFGTLNYFNFLPISTLWPKQLGFLPHKQYSNETMKQFNNRGNVTITPSPNYSPNTFQYDSEKAKTIISQYIKDNIKPEFISQKPDIKQGLTIDNRMEDSNKKQFGSYFTIKQSTISVNFHYKENTNTPNDFIIFIQPLKVDKTTITADTANTLTTSYFTHPYNPIENCNIKGATSYCETFKTEFNGKRGYGVVFANDQSVSPPKPTLIIFTCFIPKESNVYDKQKSCISP